MAYHDRHYKTHRYSRRRLRQIGWATAAAMLSLVCAALYLYGHYPRTIATKPTPTVATTSPAPDRLERYTQVQFAFDLPKGWSFVRQDSQPYTVYHFTPQATLQTRYLDIYVDKLPQNLAVNRMVAVQARDSGLIHGTLSPDCASKLPAARRRRLNFVMTAPTLPARRAIQQSLTGQYWLVPAPPVRPVASS